MSVYEINQSKKIGKKSPKRVPENLIRLFDQPATNKVESSTNKYQERKSSRWSENVHSYEMKNSTDISVESSENEDINNDLKEDLVNNENLLSEVSFSDRESLCEEQEIIDSDLESRMFKENEFHYTRDPNYLLVKNLKSKFEMNTDNF